MNAHEFSMNFFPHALIYGQFMVNSCKTPFSQQD